MSIENLRMQLLSGREFGAGLTCDMVEAALKEVDALEEKAKDLSGLEDELARLRRSIGPHHCSIHASFSAGCLNCRLAQREGRVAELEAQLANIDLHFQSGDKQAEINWDNGEEVECPWADQTVERHWWTRGYSYKWRILRALAAEAERDTAQQGIAKLEAKVAATEQFARDVATQFDNWLADRRNDSGFDSVEFDYLVSLIRASNGANARIVELEAQRDEQYEGRKAQMKRAEDAERETDAMLERVIAAEAEARRLQSIINGLQDKYGLHEEEKWALLPEGVNLADYLIQLTEERDKLRAALGQAMAEWKRDSDGVVEYSAVWRECVEALRVDTEQPVGISTECSTRATESKN